MGLGSAETTSQPSASIVLTSLSRCSVQVAVPLQWSLTAELATSTSTLRSIAVLCLDEVALLRARVHVLQALARSIAHTLAITLPSLGAAVPSMGLLATAPAAGTTGGNDAAADEVGDDRLDGGDLVGSEEGVNVLLMPATPMAPASGTKHADTASPPTPAAPTPCGGESAPLTFAKQQQRACQRIVALFERLFPRRAVQAHLPVAVAHLLFVPLLGQLYKAHQQHALLEASLTQQRTLYASSAAGGIMAAAAAAATVEAAEEELDHRKTRRQQKRLAAAEPAALNLPPFSTWLGSAHSLRQLGEMACTQRHLLETFLIVSDELLTRLAVLLPDRCEDAATAEDALRQCHEAWQRSLVWKALQGLEPMLASLVASTSSLLEFVPSSALPSLAAFIHDDSETRDVPTAITSLLSAGHDLLRDSYRQVALLVEAARSSQMLLNAAKVAS